MKEATGELNATVVVVLAIGVLIAFFYYEVWPIINKNFERNSQCSKAVCDKCENGDCEFVTCYPKGSFGDENKAFQCVYKG